MLSLKSFRGLETEIGPWERGWPRGAWYCVTLVKRPFNLWMEQVTVCWRLPGAYCACCLRGVFSDLRSTMWVIFEIFVVLFKIFICYIEAVFRAIVRPSKKDIEGQTVLITGKRYASYSLELTFPIWRWVDLPQVDLMNFRVEFVRPRSGRTE